jgi:hypothetical protein
VIGSNVCGLLMAFTDNRFVSCEDRKENETALASLLIGNEMSISQKKLRHGKGRGQVVIFGGN